MFLVSSSLHQATHGIMSATRLGTFLRLHLIVIPNNASMCASSLVISTINCGQSYLPTGTSLLTPVALRATLPLQSPCAVKRNHHARTDSVTSPRHDSSAVIRRMGMCECMRACAITAYNHIQKITTTKSQVHSGTPPAPPITS